MSALEISDALAGIAETHGGSVVRIEGGCRGGSGIVWSADGAVVTASHLVDDDAKVGLADGRSLAAKVVGRDASLDLALLKIDATGLAAAPFADLGATKVGHLTLSLARPGKSVRAALGMIGVLGESFRTRGGGRVEAYVQPDGGVPHGFSGGPLFDLHGHALGMNTHGLLRGVGLTLPTVTLKRVVAELEAHGRVRRGYLGVGVAPVRASASQHGAIVVAIEPGGPAEKAGLLVGDVLLSIDGETIDGPRALAIALADKPDAELDVVLLRAGNQTALKVKSGTRA